MSEKQKEQKEREWADRTADAEEGPEYEKTYRDGSLANECWADRKEAL